MEVCRRDSELNITLHTFLFIAFNRLSDFLLFYSSVMAAVHNVTVEKLKSRYCIVAVFISKSQPYQILKYKITVDCGFRWKWNN